MQCDPDREFAHDSSLRLEQILQARIHFTCVEVAVGEIEKKVFVGHFRTRYGTVKSFEFACWQRIRHHAEALGAPRFDNAGFHLLMRAYDRAASYVGRLTTLVSQWDPVRADFRQSMAFRQIIERQGIPAYWREHGYPPACRPRGADDYECAP